MKRTNSKRLVISAVLLICLESVLFAGGYSYAIIDTGQSGCFDNTAQAACPQEGQSFYGQDSQYAGVSASYQDNHDGTVSDLNTGLMWLKSPDLNGSGIINYSDKFTLSQARDYVSTLNSRRHCGYDDWRLPAIKELYSLIDFDGITGASASESMPYIDTDYFDFAYGDEWVGERFIDAQFCSSTEYVGTTMGGVATVFGVNFADGRIKGYPSEPAPDGFQKKFYVLYVRGNSEYGINDFVDNGDGTVTDLATGLMWQKGDSVSTMNWEQALGYAENLELADHNDWRLPNAKELQSIVDYNRSPNASDPEFQTAAIDPVFDVTETQSWYWTGTTHMDGPDDSHAAYVCFGQAWGWMEQPPYSGNYVYMDVHGAGAQRSDPKSGDPADYPYGHGPQGDEIRIYNYVRCVRTVKCGDPGYDQPKGDLNGDCNVDFEDMAVLASMWLNCTDPAPPCGYRPQ